MSRFILIALVACFLVGMLGGCHTLTFRNPLQIDAEPQTVAGPRLMQSPTYYAPTYAPAAPAQLPAGFSAPACK